MLLNKSIIHTPMTYPERGLESSSSKYSCRMLMFMSGPVLDLTDASVVCEYIGSVEIGGDIFSKLDASCSFVAYHPLGFDDGVTSLTSEMNGLTVHFTNSRDNIKVLDFNSEITWAMYATYRNQPLGLVPSVANLMPLSMYSLSTLTVGPTPDFDIQLSSYTPTSSSMQILNDLTITF